MQSWLSPIELIAIGVFRDEPRRCPAVNDLRCSSIRLPPGVLRPGLQRKVVCNKLAAQTESRPEAELVPSSITSHYCWSLQLVLSEPHHHLA
jgi:hypothetical protein